jgi:hypothetical protein
MRSEPAAEKVYRKRKDWTFRSFAEALKKETGTTLTSTQAFKLLLKLRGSYDTASTAGSRTNKAAQPSSAWMDDIARSVKKAGDAVKRKA